eukprot:13823620-Alexandrium_andersonii.AAC.1
MSASLVGSEMCIRDSPYCQLNFIALIPPGTVPVPCSKECPPALWELSRPCLLYTSDAADDM